MAHIPFWHSRPYVRHAMSVDLMLGAHAISTMDCTVTFYETGGTDEPQIGEIEIESYVAGKKASVVYAMDEFGKFRPEVPAIIFGSIEDQGRAEASEIADLLAQARREWRPEPYLAAAE